MHVVDPGTKTLSVIGVERASNFGSFVNTHSADNLLLPAWYETGCSISDAKMSFKLLGNGSGQRTEVVQSKYCDFSSRSSQGHLKIKVTASIESAHTTSY